MGTVIGVGINNRIAALDVLCRTQRRKKTKHMLATSMAAPAIAVLILLGIAAFLALRSFTSIGPTEVGLVNKRFAFRKLKDDNPIAFHGEAGYQADLLMPGLRFKLWPVYTVKKFPWVQVPAGEIGVVIAQVGQALPIGAKSGFYKSEFGNFSSIQTFVSNGGQKGVQRPVLPPGTLIPIHPAAFLVLTAHNVYGMAVSPDMQAAQKANRGVLRPESFGLAPEQLRVVIISPSGERDMVGIITVLEGEPLGASDIASRLGGWADLASAEEVEALAGSALVESDGPVPALPAGHHQDVSIIERLLASKNDLHNNYQDFQAFLSNGGRIGLQHDPLLYGAYLLNPFLVQVEMVPMLVVRQGEVAVIKAFVGLPTLDTSGAEFKFGSIVKPGHRGIWEEPLRTGKYPINPRCYASEIVPTSILTLNWSKQVSQAHSLDASLAPIEGKSREGFIFTIELQVQIHVPDTKAPKVISMVGTMTNLVNEVLASAVGNHFRNTLQDQEAIRFIETRMEVQEAALEHITRYLQAYDVETKGVYIQDVVFPVELVEVLTRREIANQEKTTYEEQQRAETARIEMEKARGMADMQAQLASSQVGINIKQNEAESRKVQAQGEAAATVAMGDADATKQRAIAYAAADATKAMGDAEASKTRAVGLASAEATQAVGLANAEATQAIGLASAKGFEAQRNALGPQATALVAMVEAIAKGQVNIMPEVLVTGGGGGSFEGLASVLMSMFRNNGLTPGTQAETPPEVAATVTRKDA
ncbi:MAG: SPFH domain-containing protein [Acidimicrobiia bacterium]